ncbi:transposase [Streptomyces atrovirens]|uniref:Transposase n=1 Tax=Streptomyces atrovirens TaxID=285556 RepID=A0ABW0E0M6_9ACTN
MRATCARSSITKRFDGEGDHVHLLAHHPPKAQFPKPVDSLKGVFARLLRKGYDAHVRRRLRGRTLPVRLPLRRRPRRGAPGPSRTPRTRTHARAGSDEDRIGRGPSGPETAARGSPGMRGTARRGAGISRRRPSAAARRPAAPTARSAAPRSR